MTKKPDWLALRLALEERSRGLCEGCGLPRGEFGAAHHRMLRSRGGGHGLENLIVLHPACHRFAHANPAWATTHGWIVSSWQRPEEVPVVVCSTGLGCGH